MNDPSDPRRETVRYRARFDECGPDGRLRTSGLMRWAQDCAWVHSQRLGFGREWYAARGLWWLVRCAELSVPGHVALGETASVTTAVVGWRRVLARRRTSVVGADGRPVATVFTDWVLTDARGMPTRVPADFAEIFGGAEPFDPARVSLEPTPPDAVELRFAVRDHEIDPMAHANNAVYVDWIEEAAGALGMGALAYCRLEYVAAAARGADVIGRAWRTGDGVSYRLTSAAGTELLRAVARTTDGEPGIG